MILRTRHPDSAYRAKEREEGLVAKGFESQIHEKRARGHPLNEEQKVSNRVKSRTRVRVEHVFGAQHAMGGHIVRTIGLARARVKIGMMNLVYNMQRLGQLLKREVQVQSRETAMTGEVRPQSHEKQQMLRKVMIFTGIPGSKEIKIKSARENLAKTEKISQPNELIEVPYNICLSDSEFLEMPLW